MSRRTNGHGFEMENLHDGEIRTLDIGSAMHKGTRNIVLVAANGPRGGSAVLIMETEQNWGRLPVSSPSDDVTTRATIT